MTKTDEGRLLMVTIWSAGIKGVSTSKAAVVDIASVIIARSYCFVINQIRARGRSSG